MEDPVQVPIESKEILTPNNSTSDKTPSPPPQEPRKKSKKESKESKKDDKNIEQFMKSLNSISNIDEKLSLLCKKYVQATEEIKKLQFYIKQSDKHNAVMLKEKEHLQHEYNKIILVKSKLENLCRELQKQNKAIKEESLLKIREEEERRKETQAKFQNTLSEITTLLQQNNDKNVKLRDDNISMSEKFKSVLQQYQLREQQVDKMAKQMTLESQLADAKLQKASLEHQAERERLVAEMEQIKVTMAQYKAKILEMQGTETALKSQLSVYTDKYDEFQNALTKSNQVFGGFKEQMEMMSKKIKKLEKESVLWKKKWETSQRALLDMCGERQICEERAVTTTRQLQHMQSLCRTLQAERTVLLTTLKEHSIERPPLPANVLSPCPVPAPATNPSKASDAKMDAMVANCAQLRQSLAHLQSQLNVLTTNKKENATEEPAKPEKQKKSKSKKSKAEKQTAKTETEKGDMKESEGEEQKVIETANSNNSTNETEPVSEMTKSHSKVSTEINTDEDTQQTINGENNLSDVKVDDKTMETLLQAINVANINLDKLEADNTEDIKLNIIDTVGDTGITLPQNNAELVEYTINNTNIEKTNVVLEKAEASSTNEEISNIAEEPLDNILFKA